MSLPSKSPTIPTITNSAQLEQMLQVWKNALRKTINQAPSPPPPLNFRATSARGGIQLTWGLANPLIKRNILGGAHGAAQPDGYELLVSKNGSFTDVQVVSLNDVTQTQYFFPVGGGPASYSFKLHTTAGTGEQPQSVYGPDTGTVRHTSIDPNDTTTKPTIKVDNVTNDSVRATARQGRYPAQYLQTYRQLK